MNREQFSSFITKGNRINNPATAPVVKESVTDPSYFQTGRQMLVNPLPIQPRVSYYQGAPLSNDNPMQINEYDKMYGDRFKAVNEAKDAVDNAKTNLKKIEDNLFKQQPQQN